LTINRRGIDEVEQHRDAVHEAGGANLPGGVKYDCGEIDRFDSKELSVP
jgi:hypothetical protein